MPSKVHRNLALAVVANLREILEQDRYADRVVEQSLKSDSRWGARDRRFVAETTYDIVRWRRRLRELTQAGENDYWSLLGAWFLTNGFELPRWDELAGITPELIAGNAGRVESTRALRESIPDWLDALGERELGAAWDRELAALNEQARVVLRANTLKTSRDALADRLREEAGIETDTVDECPDALVLRERRNLFTLPAFREGLFELQDAGSQRIAPFLDVEPGMRVIDACAGAGGKTLHLAALMQGKGRILALDTDERKLAELRRRARRAGASDIVETRLIDSSKVVKRLAGSADRVLLDVPCSGLGVLRRNPDAKWKLSPDFLDRVQSLQREILRRYPAMLKSDATLVYATCSILPSENARQIDALLAEPGGGFCGREETEIVPSSGFDGFYLCRLRR